MTHATTMAWMAGCAALLAGTAPAQQKFVWPAGHTNTEGNSSQAAPFSVSTAWNLRGSRSTTLIAAGSVPFGAGSAITAIAFRRDGQDPATYAALTGSYEVRIGEVADALTPVEGPREPFLSTPQLIGWGSLNQPAAGPPGAGTAPFSIALPFRTPWVWNGNDFGIDVNYNDNATPTWHRDAVYVQPITDAAMRALGAGCKATVPFEPLTWVTGRTGYYGGSLDVMVQAAPLPAGGSAILMLGTQLPGPLSLAQWLPAGCNLYVSPLAQVTTATVLPTNQFSYAMQSLAIPNTPVIAGGIIGLQWLVADTTGTAIGLVVSNGLNAAVGRPAASTPDYGRSFWGYGVTGTGMDYTGHLGPPSYVPVIEFTL